MRVEIEVPDLPEEFAGEWVTDGEIGTPAEGQLAYGFHARKYFVRRSAAFGCSCLLFRRVVNPESVRIRLRPGWHAKNSAGDWFRWKERPERGGCGWAFGSGPEIVVGVTGFPEVPWQDSLFYVPEVSNE